MNELEFPWEMDIIKVIPREYTNIYDIKFEKNGKILTGLNNLVAVKNLRIRILNLKITPNPVQNSFGVNFVVRNTSPIPQIKNIDVFSALFKSSEFKAIPKDLFKYNPQITSIESAFKDCNYLKYIPKSLFKNNKKIIDFFTTFSNCVSIESLPYGLFPKNEKSEQHFDFCFSGCKKLKKIPNGLFRYVDNSNLDYAFEYCENLEIINGDIFSNNTELDDEYFNKIFNNCPKLKNIPKEILMKLI